ncbi:hypothetical protein PMAYCL1PPCAC_27937, partial [Pristionchus mayeri]
SMRACLPWLRRSRNTDLPEGQSLSTTQMHATTDEARPTESPDGEPINEDRPSGEILIPSLSSPITPSGDSGVTDSIRQVSGCLSIVGTQTPRDVNSIEISNPFENTETLREETARIEAVKVEKEEEERMREEQRRIEEEERE